jgi:sugar/nucleoside kinase (ribokinase family)
MAKDRPVVCLGIMVADLVARPVTSFPRPLTLVEEMSLHTGGCAVNVAVALAKLGIPAEVMGKVGPDALGDFMIRELGRRGVGTAGVRRDGRRKTSATMVLVSPEGERGFIHYLGANAGLVPGDVDGDRIRRAWALHVAGALVLSGLDGPPLARILGDARSSGVVTFLDTVWDASGRWMELVGPLLPHADYFVPSIAEARRLTGRERPEEVARSLLDRGVGTVALKMAEEGCYVADREGREIRTPAFRVDVVDSTGAGDAFAAGFIAGIRNGWPLERTADFANAMGALCVTAMGASAGLRTFDETVAFLEGAPGRI